MILSQGGSGIDNYFHWLFDILPKIKICSEIYKLWISREIDKAMKLNFKLYNLNNVL